MTNAIKYRVFAVPNEAVGAKNILASEVGTKLGSQGTGYALTYTGLASEIGQQDGSPNYLEASDSANTAICSNTITSFLYIRNTGNVFSSAQKLGVNSEYYLKILAGSSVISILRPNEAIILKDDNSNIDCSGIYVRTVDTDGTESSSLSHLAVEYFVVSNGTSLGDFEDGLDDWTNDTFVNFAVNNTEPIAGKGDLGVDNIYLETGFEDKVLHFIVYQPNPLSILEATPGISGTYALEAGLPLGSKSSIRSAVLPTAIKFESGVPIKFSFWGRLKFSASGCNYGGSAWLQVYNSYTNATEAIKGDWTAVSGRVASNYDAYINPSVYAITPDFDSDNEASNQYFEFVFTPSETKDGYLFIRINNASGVACSWATSLIVDNILIGGGVKYCYREYELTSGKTYGIQFIGKVDDSTEPYEFWIGQANKSAGFNFGANISVAAETATQYNREFTCNSTGTGYLWIKSNVEISKGNFDNFIIKERV
jgi:hypothetical protein